MSKTKLDDVIKKAKNSLSNAKSAVNNFKAKNGVDKVIPGFSAYAINSAGQILNRKSGKIQNIPTGKNKYFLFDDKGTRRNISIEEILLKTKVVNKEQPTKRKFSKVSPVLSNDFSNLSQKEILELPVTKNKKAFLLFSLKQKTYAEISDILNSPIPSIKRDIWKFQTGQTTME